VGVDCMLFVVADWSRHGNEERDTAFPTATFELKRERDLWERLEALPQVAPPWPRLQVPRGSWVTYHDGAKPADQDDRELGYLTEDSYGRRLQAVSADDLAKVPSEYEPNRQILAFVGVMYPRHEVILVWH
jgi:hypothetical protein